MKKLFLLAFATSMLLSASIPDPGGQGISSAQNLFITPAIPAGASEIQNQSIVAAVEVSASTGTVVESAGMSFLEAVASGLAVTLAICSTIFMLMILRRKTAIPWQAS